MNLIIKTSLLILMLFFFSCSHPKKDNIKTQYFNNQMLPQETLESKIVSKIKLRNPSDIIYCNNFLYLSYSKGEKLVSIYDIKKRKNVKEFLTRGRGPSELLSIHSINKNLINNSIVFFDVITSKYLVYDITCLQNNSPTLVSEGVTKTNPYKEQVIYTNDSLFMYLGLDTRMVFQNKDGNIIKAIGNYDIYNNNEKNIWLTQIYNGKIAYNNKTNQFAIFDRLTDKIEFYNDYKLEKILSGPDLFTEEYKIISVGNGYALAHYKDKTHIAYEHIAFNSEYILALYSGETFHDDGINHNTIIKFDWEGNPIKVFKLDTPICAFDIDWDNEIIYGLNVDSIPLILKYQM